MPFMKSPGTVMERKAAALFTRRHEEIVWGVLLRLKLFEEDGSILDKNHYETI